MALAVATLAIAARAEAYVYWTETNGRIGRANLDGTGVDHSFITDAGRPSTVAVDGAHIYWTNENGTIGRANLNGSNVDQNFIAVGEFLRSLAVGGGHIYWGANDSIGRANLDRTGVELDFILGARGGTRVAVDASHIYWNNGRTIARANLDGTGVDFDFIDSSGFWVAVDHAHLYWTSPPDSYTAIARANLDGTGIEPGFIDLGRPAVPNPTPYEIAVGDHIYWVTGTGGAVGTIGRADLDGSRATNKLITGFRSFEPRGLALDALGPPPSNEFGYRGIKLDKKRGSAKLTVNVAGPGELELAGSPSVKGQRERAAQSGTLRLSVKAKGKARRRLNKRGKAKVKAKVTFTPDGGTSATRSKTIKLVKR